MSDHCPDILAALRERERDLELQAMAIRARIEEVRETIAKFEQRSRSPRGRPRRLTPVQPLLPDDIEEGTG